MRNPTAKHHEPQPKLWTLTFLTFLSISFCIFLGFDMLLPTLALYLDGQGCQESQIGLIFASFAISSVISRFLAARLSRRMGATRVVRRGLVLCFAGTFMFYVIPHPLFYALARLMHGAGFGLTSTLMVSMAAQVIPPRRLGEGLGYLGLGATVALAIGPLLGIWLSGAYGYKVMFTCVAFCYVAATLISLSLPAIKLASDSFQGDMGLKSFWEVRAFPPASLVLLFGIAACSVSAYLAIYCQEARLPSAAIFFVVSTIGTLAARLGSGRVYDRYGHVMVIPPALACMASAMLAIVLSPSPFVLYAASVVYGLGMGSLFPSFQAMTLSAVSPDKRTVAAAIFSNAFDIGIGLGTAMMGFLAQMMGTYAVVYLAAVGVLALVLAMYLFFFKSRPKSQTPIAKIPSPPAAGGAAGSSA